MATAPVYYTDRLVKEFIDKNFAGKTGAELYDAVANEAAKQGVSAEQVGRVLGFDTAAVNKYATDVGKPLVTEQKALTDVIDYAYNTQFGRDATVQEAKDAQAYLTGGGTNTNQQNSVRGTGILNQSLEGYNYDTQSIISGYRSTLGRNPTQTEYVSAMATLGYDPFNPTVLGEAGKLSANVAALESDPFAGRYANANPYGTYDVATQTYKLDGTLPNISQTSQGNSVQFISPVTQRPITTSFVNGKLVVKDGVDTLTGEQAQTAINLALNTGALTATEYKNLTGSLASAKSMDDVYKAFGTPQAVTALDPNYGFQLGVGKTLAQAQENSVGVQALVDQIAAANGGRLPANFSVANLAKTANVPFQFGQDVYNKSFTTDAGTPITTMARSPTVMFNPATPSAPFNFNPANIYAPPIVAGQMRELFPSFGESKRLAQGLINERPSTQSIVNMIQGGSFATNPTFRPTATVAMPAGLMEAYTAAEKSGNYGDVANLLKGLTTTDLRNFGASPADIAYITSRPQIAGMFTTATPATAVPSLNNVLSMIGK